MNAATRSLAPRLRAGLARFRQEIVVSLLLTAAVLVAFGNCCRCGFINFDDDFYVTDNPDVQAGLTLRSLGWAWSSHRAFWHPLTWMSLQLDSQLYGVHPAGFHATNLLLHVANTLLLFWLLRRLTGRVGASAAVAMLFALHPLRVEAVTWISERKGLLSAFFGLLSLWFYAAYAAQPRLSRYLVMALLFFAALLAKPMLVTLPVLLLLLDYWPLQRLGQAPAAGRPSLRWLIAEKLPLLVLALLVSWRTLVAEQQVGAVSAAPELHLANAVMAYVEYLGKTIWPSSLALFYPGVFLSWSMWQIAGAVALLLTITVLVLAAARRQPALAVGWLWYGAALVPVCGLIQVGSHALADRYTYIPHIGLGIALVWGIDACLSRWRLRALVLVPACTALGLALLVTSWNQVQPWRQSRTLWEHALRVTTGNWIAHNNLGVLLAREGRKDEAMGHYAAALRIVPHYWEAHLNLGELLEERGRLAEAREHYDLALRIRPECAPALEGLGEVCWREGKQAEAMKYLRAALSRDPRRATAHNRLGMGLLLEGKPEEAERHFMQALKILPRAADMHANLGAALYNQGKVTEAIAHFGDALRIKPKYAAAHHKLGIALQRQGKLTEAVGCYTEALRLKPALAEAHLNLGTALEEQGKRSEALVSYRRAVAAAPTLVKYRCYLACTLMDLGETAAAQAVYRETLRIEPRWPATANQVARTLATAPDPLRRYPASAIHLARQACQASAERQPAYLETLALAYAAAGQSAEAAKAAGKASALEETAPGRLPGGFAPAALPLRRDP